MSDESPESGSAARTRPRLLFDGDCGFCRAWVQRWAAYTGTAVEYAAAQDVAADYPHISPDAFSRSVQFVDSAGRVSEGAQAVFSALAHGPTLGSGWPLWLYQHVPGVAFCAEVLYRYVARRRAGFAWLTRTLWGASVLPAGFVIGRFAFLRALALVYLVAVVSLWVQIDGLIGRNGILPVESHLAAVQQAEPQRCYWLAPTLLWFNASDMTLHGLCAAGVVLSILALAACAEAFCFAGLWLIYLSLTVAGQEFLGFQWDQLLLETGFLALLVVPWRVRPSLGVQQPPSGAGLFLLSWLLFRLMFSSGIVKLGSGDPAWWNLSALEVHYETQPLPVWTSWYAHHLPSWLHRTACASMFVIELAVPFLIFAPRRARHLAALLFIALQMGIAATGNYAYFNLLTAALCLPLLDDRFWPQAMRARFHLPPDSGTLLECGSGRCLPPASVSTEPLAPRPTWRTSIVVAGTLFLFGLGLIRMLERWTLRPPEWVQSATAWTEPLRLSSAYGLFAIMTTERPEIVIEGSHDQVTWLPYEFNWKPGPPGRAPTFVAPHQPRLDWQMWFAALSAPRQNPWFGNLLFRLLEGRAEVLELLRHNPFPDKPPRFIRAVLYRYRFSPPGSTDWWLRHPVRMYVRSIFLQGG